MSIRSSSTILRLAIAAALLTLLPRPAAADLADLIPTLFGTRIILAPPGPGFPSHEAHFLDSSLALAATGRTVNASLLEQISAFPIASSAGGFTYNFDSSLGTFTRSTDSFGPVYTERAETIGRGRWNLGVNYLQESYDKLDDLALNGSGIPFQLRHLDSAPTDSNPDDVPQPFFEGDVIGVREQLDVKTRTVVIYGNYGVSDRFDLAVAVPMVKVDIAARATLSINHLSTFAQPQIHQFVGGGDTETISASDSASGIGDVLLRGKYRFVQAPWGGLAAALDVRLPTGDEKNLLGTGATQTRLTFIGSGQSGILGVHGNLGYSVASGGGAVIADVPNELSYAAGLDVAVHPRLTLAGEIVGRTLFDATRAQVAQVHHVFQAGSGGPTESVDLPEVTFTKDDVNLLLGSVGVKFNPAGNLLLSADALYPIGNQGLRDTGVTAVVGAEYSF